MSIFTSARTAALDALHTARTGLGSVNDVAERFESHERFGSIASRVTDLVAQATDLVDNAEADFFHGRTAPSADSETPEPGTEKKTVGLGIYDDETERLRERLAEQAGQKRFHDDLGWWHPEASKSVIHTGARMFL